MWKYLIAALLFGIAPAYADYTPALNIEITTLPGIVLGTGQTSGVRASNGTILQNAINAAASSGQLLTCASNTNIEFDLAAGMVVTPSGSGFQANLSKSCVFFQFHANAPILVLGDPTGATSYAGVHWSGGGFSYGASQTGNTSAIGLLEGSLYFSHLEHMSVTTVSSGNAPVNPGYDGWDQGNRSNTGGFNFQNHYNDITIGGAQASIFRENLNGTGNLFEDIYWADGSTLAAAGTLSDFAVSLNAVNGAARTDDTFIRCNIEHLHSASGAININDENNINFIGLHLEAFQITGNGASVITGTSSQSLFSGTKFLDVALSGTGSSYFKVNYGGRLAINNTYISFDATGFLSTGEFIFAGLAGTESTYSDNSFTMDHVGFNDTPTNLTNMTIDPVTGTNLTTVSGIQHYEYSGLMPIADHPILAISTTSTVYGDLQNPTIQVPSSISAAVTITLADTMKASGTGSTLTPITGVTVEVVRASAANSNTLTIKDGGGTSLATPAVGSRTLYRFNGTAWVSVT